ncbi:hypothetical protein M948_06010 [Virgibacillus sp. CM-4]|uniref:glycosyltransferase family 4 protein n=1 Tax=Virgibacillus sp. CM-4 TaxID=1354277 RepID=UPI0003886F01|nr:glycosyltransferase family 4 protein [Virgibacillus sp. CM-4]EQB38127.1 hypothetical protein M948_06010 [Virgibacillus sp. CM-4]
MSRKILIISQNFYPEIGSAGNRIKNIYTLLKKNGNDVQVLTTDPTYPNKKIYQSDQFWDDGELNNDLFNIERIKIKNKKYSRSIFNRLFYYVEMALKMFVSVIKSQNKYDIVYTTSPPIFVAIVGLFAKIKFNAKLILDVRDLWPESLKGVGVFDKPAILNVFKMIEKLLYKKSDNIVVNSSGFIEHITNYSASFIKKINYIPNGARAKEINPASNSRSFKVIYAGNIGLAQDDKILMQLSQELKKHNIEFTIIGYGLRREGLKHYIETNSLDNVTFLEPLNREECLRVISEHHVGIVTLMDKEVFKTVLPGKIIDYMTCGVPVVGSVSGLSKDIILNQDIGYVANNNVEELMKYIHILHKDPSLREEKSNNGKRFVVENFLWESNIHSLLEIINS